MADPAAWERSVRPKLVPGHREGDLVFGSGNGQIATRVERQTRYVMLDGKDSQTVVNALIKNARQLNSIARQLNERPRKTLGFHTPAEQFSECVATTG